jgi:hypothetical protein
MNVDPSLTPIEEADSNRRTQIMILIGIFIFGACALFTLAFFWFQPNRNTLFAKYFPSSTATRRPANTSVPTRIPIPNLTATQSAWIKPSQSPRLGTSEEAQKAFESGMSYLESFAAQIPDTPEINQPGDVYIYEIQLDQPEPVIWSYGWCTTTQTILEENFTHTQIDFIINEEPASLDHFFIQDTTRDDGSLCRDYTATIKEWPKGQHQLEVRVTFTKPTNDGWNLYPAGTHTFKYIVTVN